MHVAFGASAGIGGTVARFRSTLDVVVTDATLTIGDTTVLDAGRALRPLSVLLAVPNVSEGRDPAVLEAIGAAFAAGGARVLDVHADPDHNRAVFTLAAEPGTLHEALAEGARAAIERIDLTRHEGPTTHVGASTSRPSSSARRSSAGPRWPRRSRWPTPSASSAFRSSCTACWPTGARAPSCGQRGRGPRAADGRRPAARLRPDRMHPTAGAMLVAARPPLVAFNLELGPQATADDARADRARHPRGRPGGPAGPARHRPDAGRARDVAQVSCNVEDQREALPLAALLEAVERHAPVAEAELVGLAPQAAFAGWPERVPIRNQATLEERLSS